MAVLRRVAPANAAARAASANPLPPARPPIRTSPHPAKRTEVIGKGFVSTSMKDSRSTFYEESKEVEVLRAEFTEEDPPAHIRVGAGMTFNTGNYESLRIDCAVTIPCQRDKLEEAYQIASDFVVDKINAEEIKWLGQTQPKKGKT